MKLLAALILLAPALAAADVVDRDTVEINPNADVLVERVEVENPLGDVTVVGHDGADITLRVVKRAPDEATLDRLKVTLVPDPAGVVRIRSSLQLGDEARPFSRRAASARVDIEVSVPRRARVGIRVYRGDVSVRDLRAAVATESTRGHQRVTNVRGNVSASGTYGDVELERIEGDELTARTHDGRVVATGITARRVTIRSTYGQVIFEGRLAAGGEYDVRSFHGDVEIRLGRDSAVSIAAYSRAGQVESKLEMASGSRRDGQRLEGSYGPSRRKPALLSVSSLAGNVTVGLINE